MKQTPWQAVAASMGLMLTLGLAGCASAAEVGSPTKTQPAVSTSTAEISAASLEETCDQLFGTDMDGLVHDGMDIIQRLLEAPDMSTITVDEVGATVEALESAQAKAADELQPFIGEIITPLASVLDMIETGDLREIAFSDFSAAGIELLNRCNTYLTAGLEPAAAPTPPATATETLAGASSIEVVWAKLGCKENDPMGTRGIIDLNPSEPPVARNGSCTPYADGELAFFYQLADPATALNWLDSGGLEIGATDAVFIDGEVVILATDAGTALRFSNLFAAYSG